MASYNAPGGGTIDSGDKRIERKVVVATGGSNPAAPGGTGRLTNVSITEEAGGIRRGVFEYTEGGSGDASYNAYGKKIELLGGSRELPIYTHPDFANLSKAQVLSVQKAVDEKRDPNFTNTYQQKLFEFLSRGTEYWLAPSLVARVSEIESGLPDTSNLCKQSSPAGVGAPGTSFWVMTGISAVSIGDKFEVTREYTSIPVGWADAQTLYD